jgi:hypothetical protein
MTAYPPPPDQPTGGPYPPPPPPPGFPPQQGGPWPAQPAYPGQPGQSPVPPPPPGTAPVAKAPPVTWLLPLASLLAVIGAVTPWFRPHGEAGGTSKDFDNLYSFKDGKIGLVAPIVLIVIAVMAFGLLRGKVSGRLSSASDPVRAVAKYAIIAGVVSAVCLLIAWFLVTTQYKFELDGSELSWNDFESKLKAVGGSLSRGPQIGYWLTAAAALVAIVGGVLMMLTTRSDRPEPQLAPTSLQKPPPPPA